VQFHIWRVTDRFGTHRDVGATHDEETVSVSGLRISKRKPVFFEGKAYHLWSWAETHGFTTQRFVAKVDLDPMSITLERKP
jgi:hypothetical protein